MSAEGQNVILIVQSKMMRVLKPEVEVAARSSPLEEQSPSPLWLSEGPLGLEKEVEPPPASLVAAATWIMFFWTRARERPSCPVCL